jgi:hypothetical protein
MRTTAGLLLGIALAATGTTAFAADTPTTRNAMDTVAHLQDFQVVEFRRYTTAPNERAHFVGYFDMYFPEAFEQLGAMVFGQFTERANPDHFTWLRGFKDLNARPIVNSAFYYGPLWKEHRIKVNAILPDSDNVMLLQPLRAEDGIAVLPAVDPVTEPDGATGVVVMQIFPVAKGRESAFAKRAEAEFARYRIPGVHPSGVLVTLDVTNNFPQLPIRTDGPWLVWVGVVRDDGTLQAQLLPAMTAAAKALGATGLLRGETEQVVMDPTPRSRLRWLDSVAP